MVTSRSLTQFNPPHLQPDVIGQRDHQLPRPLVFSAPLRIFRVGRWRRTIPAALPLHLWARRHQALVFLRLAPAAFVTLLRVMPPVLSRDDLSHVPAELLPSHLLRWRALGAMARASRRALRRTADSFASFHETPRRLYRCHC